MDDVIAQSTGRQGDEPIVTYPPEMLPKNDEDYDADVIVIQFCECFGFTANEARDQPKAAP